MTDMIARDNLHVSRRIRPVCLRGFLAAALVTASAGRARAAEVIPPSSRRMRTDPAVQEQINRLFSVAADTGTNKELLAEIDKLRKMASDVRSVVPPLLRGAADIARGAADLEGPESWAAFIAVSFLFYDGPFPTDYENLEDSEFDKKLKRPELLESLVPLLGERDPTLKEIIWDILGMACASPRKGNYDDLTCDYSHFEALLRTGEEPPPVLVEYMYYGDSKAEPGKALLLLAGRCMKNAAERRDLARQVGIVEKNRDDLVGRRYGPATTAGLERALQVLDELAQRKEWWIRLYVASTMSETRAYFLRSKDIVERLRRDRDSVVREFVTSRWKLPKKPHTRGGAGADTDFSPSRSCPSRIAWLEEKSQAGRLSAKEIEYCVPRSRSLRSLRDQLRKKIANRLRAYEPIVRDWQAIRDIVGWRFRRVRDETGDVLVVGEIIPEPLSGMGRIPGAYIKAWSGEMVVPEDSCMVVRIEGTFSIISVLVGSPKKKKWEYEWEEKADFAYSSGPRTQKERPRWYSAIDSSGGVVICRLNEKAEGRDQFTEIHLLPQGWKRFVKPAWDYYRENREVFRAEGTKRNRGRLLSLLRSENPLLAVEACRLVVEAGLADKEVVKNTIANSRAYKQATLLLVFMRNVAQENYEDFLALLTSLVDEKHEESEWLRGLALGFFVGSYDAPNSISYRMATRLLDVLRQRKESLKPAPETGDYVHSILEMSGADEKDAGDDFADRH